MSNKNKIVRITLYICVFKNCECFGFKLCLNIIRASNVFGLFFCRLGYLIYTAFSVKGTSTIQRLGKNRFFGKKQLRFNGVRRKQSRFVSAKVKAPAAYLYICCTRSRISRRAVGSSGGGSGGGGGVNTMGNDERLNRNARRTRMRAFFNKRFPIPIYRVWFARVARPHGVVSERGVSSGRTRESAKPRSI